MLTASSGGFGRRPPLLPRFPWSCLIRERKENANEEDANKTTKAQAEGGQARQADRQTDQAAKERLTTLAGPSH